MPESRWRAHSVRNPNPSFPTVTCPEYPPSKYLPIASAIRALTRARNASPTSMFFPEIRKGMARPPLSAALFKRSSSKMLRRSARDVKGGLLFPSPLHRGGDTHCLAVFRHGTARDVDAGGAQLLDDCVVGQHVGRVFRVDELLDPVPH